MISTKRVLTKKLESRKKMKYNFLFLIIVFIVSCTNPQITDSTDIDMNTVSHIVTDSSSVYLVPVNKDLSIASIEILVSGSWLYLDSFDDSDFDIAINTTHDTMVIFDNTMSYIDKIRIKEIRR
jgi:hypothetical protein